MKEFLKRYSYSSVKLFLNQFAISLLGAALALATAKNDMLLLTTSIFAIAFYLFLVYTTIWAVGAKDRISIDVQKLKYKPLTGLYIGFLANSLNFIIAIFMIIGLTKGLTNETAGNIGGVGRLISLFTEGMYIGLTGLIKIGGKEIYNFWLTYFLMTVPALLVSTIAYIFGHHDIRFTNLMIDKNPEEAHKKSRFFDGNFSNRNDKDKK